MGTEDVQARRTRSSRSRRPGVRRRIRRALVAGVTVTLATGTVGVASAQDASGGGTAGSGASGLAVTAVALGLTAVVVGGVYFFGWRDRPEPTFTPATPTEEVDRVPNRHTGPMFESDVAERETASVDHDAFDPVGTGTLIAIYFAVVSLVWLFMYFVEFLGNGPTVVG